MTAETAFGWIEAAQMGVASVGLVVACLEWRQSLLLLDVEATDGQRVLARQAVRVEAMRAVVHLTIMFTAGIALTLPDPPDYMPHWISQALLARKLGLLIVATVCCAGTVTSRLTRLAFARLQQP